MSVKPSLTSCDAETSTAPYDDPWTRWIGYGLRSRASTVPIVRLFFTMCECVWAIATEFILEEQFDYQVHASTRHSTVQSPLKLDARIDSKFDQNT